MPCPTDMPDELILLMPDMARFARHLTGNRDQAQDLCQDVLLKLWIRMQRGEDIADLRAYAMTALRNQYRQSLRDRMPGDLLDEADDAHEPEVFAALALRELEEAVTHLPEAQARLIRLVAEGETSPRTLARITGWPLGTVMSRLARARARLRAHVGLAGNAPTADLL